jgi:phosphoribosylglycinamide formyltransferase 1
MTKKRLAVLISGNGSNLQALINACQQEEINAEIVVVCSNKKDAYGLIRAANANIPGIYHPYIKNSDRSTYDAALAQHIMAYQPDLIILAGWMRKLSMAFLAHFPNKVINIHPALPDTFPGTHAIERAYEAFRRGEIKESGVMIHYVPDEGVDNGPVIGKEVVPIHENDTLESFETKIHQTEHRLYVEALSMQCNSIEV